MSTSSTSNTLISPPASQLVFALTNVYSQFSFKLSTDGSKYKLWRRIFLDMCKGAKVHGHITGKSKPASDDDEDWEAIDSRIKSWFYSTCDANLLQIISSDNCTAKDLWDKLDEFFLNNKMSRMLQLQEQFRNTKKGTSTITDFCHNLKNLADALTDCDSKIDEIELVMQILRQLPPSYHSIVDVITNTKPFPSFLEAKNMLLLHESREESTDPHPETPLTSSSALYSSSQPGKSKNKLNKGRNNGRFASKGGGVILMSPQVLTLLQVLRVIRDTLRLTLDLLMLLLLSLHHNQVFLVRLLRIPSVLHPHNRHPRYLLSSTQLPSISHQCLLTSTDSSNNTTRWQASPSLARPRRHLLSRPSVVMPLSMPSLSILTCLLYFRQCRFKHLRITTFTWIPVQPGI